MFNDEALQAWRKHSFVDEAGVYWSFDAVALGSALRHRGREAVLVQYRGQLRGVVDVLGRGEEVVSKPGGEMEWVSCVEKCELYNCCQPLLPLFYTLNLLFFEIRHLEHRQIISSSNIIPQLRFFLLKVARFCAASVESKSIVFCPLRLRRDGLLTGVEARSLIASASFCFGFLRECRGGLFASAGTQSLPVLMASVCFDSLILF